MPGSFLATSQFKPQLVGARSSSSSLAYHKPRFPLVGNYISISSFSPNNSFMLLFALSELIRILVDLSRKRAGLISDKDLNVTGGMVRMKPEDPMKETKKNLSGARAALGCFFVCSGHEERRSLGLLPKMLRRKR